MLKRWELWLVVALVLVAAVITYWWYSTKDNAERKEPESPKEPLNALPEAIDLSNIPNHVYANGQTLKQAAEEYNNTPVAEMPGTPHFAFKEFWTRDANYNRYPPPKEYWPNIQHLMNQLEIIRAEIGHKSIHVNSGVRSEWHNTAAGGVSRSYHRLGQGADITVHDANTDEVQDTIQRLRDTGQIDIGGIGKGVDWTHVDTGSIKKEWSYNY